MMIRRLTLLLACILMMCACHRDYDYNAFVQSNDIRLQVGSTVQFRYTPSNCQLGFNRQRGEFRVSTDNMSDYFVATLSEIPASQGQKVSADLLWTTSTDILTKKNVTLEVVRLEGDRIWLWSHSGRIGLTVQVLE